MAVNCNWIKLWNEEPKPFVLTKTAEEILDSLARYISRITVLLGFLWVELSG